jgi:hypothetical protein
MSRPSPSFHAYRTALLGYILSRGESGLTHAYELGRASLNGGGCLHLVHMHLKAMNEILSSKTTRSEIRRRLNASTEFLIEALSPFEMAFRGYVALRKTRTAKQS